MNDEIAFESSRLYYTPFSPADAEIIFRWRSDKAIIRYFYSPNPPSWENHIAWMQRRSSDCTRKDFVIHQKSDNAPIGAVYLTDILADTCEIGYYIGETGHHGKGYGSEAVKALCDYAAVNCGIHTLTAFIHQDNLPSLKLIQKLGFQQCGVQPPYLEFKITGNPRNEHFNCNYQKLEPF